MKNIKIFRLTSGEIIIARIVEVDGKPINPAKGIDQSVTLINTHTFKAQSPFVLVAQQNGLTIIPLIAWAAPPKEPLAVFNGNNVAVDLVMDDYHKELVEGYIKSTSRIEIVQSLAGNVVPGNFPR